MIATRRVSCGGDFAVVVSERERVVVVKEREWKDTSERDGDVSCCDGGWSWSGSCIWYGNVRRRGVDKAIVDSRGDS